MKGNWYIHEWVDNTARYDHFYGPFCKREAATFMAQLTEQHPGRCYELHR